MAVVPMYMYPYKVQWLQHINVTPNFTTSSSLNSSFLQSGRRTGPYIFYLEVIKP